MRGCRDFITPAKGVGRVTGARVQISPSPPKPRNYQGCGVYVIFHKFNFFTPFLVILSSITTSIINRTNY